MTGSNDRDEDKDSGQHEPNKDHDSGCHEPNKDHDYKKDGPDGRDCPREGMPKGPEPTEHPDPRNSPFPY